MIGTEFLKGQGLGNQLFCYVTARCIAKERGCAFGTAGQEQLAVNIHSKKGMYFMDLDLGERIPDCEVPGKGERASRLSRYEEKELRLYQNTSLHDMEHGCYIAGADEALHSLPDNTLIYGNMQAESYFGKYREEIREWLKVKEEYDTHEFTRDNLCILNVRGGEYTGNLELYLERRYWMNAMKNMRKVRADMEFIVVSDDPEAARKLLPGLTVYHSDLDRDYVMLKNARYLILSNSSFAFFPAYTSDTLKLAIAPKYWARHNVSDGYWASEQNIYSIFQYQDRSGRLFTAEECRSELERWKQTSARFRRAGQKPGAGALRWGRLVCKGRIGFFYLKRMFWSLMRRAGYRIPCNPERKQKHIALFISSLRKGGSERVLVNLAEYLAGQGWRVTMVTQYRGEVEYPLPDGASRVFSEITQEEAGKGRAGNFLARFRKLRGIWKRERPDVILSFIGKNNVMALLTSAFLGIPVAVSVRGEPKEEYASASLRFLAKILFGRAAGIILQSERAKDFFPEGIRKKAVVLKNPLNPDFVRRPYDGEREKEIVAVGRVDANKNHEMIIRAFGKIAEHFPEYRLTIYGDGVLRGELIRLAEELGLSGRISLPGPVSDVADRIWRSGMFVLASYSEGMPNTLLEAMCMGLPVISTNCSGGGAAELIRDGENGRLVPPGDTDALAEAMAAWMEDPEEAKACGLAASGLLEGYRPDAVARTWMDYLDGLRK